MGVDGPIHFGIPPHRPSSRYTRSRDPLRVAEGTKEGYGLWSRIRSVTHETGVLGTTPVVSSMFHYLLRATIGTPKSLGHTLSLVPT